MTQRKKEIDIDLIYMTTQNYIFIRRNNEKIHSFSTRIEYNKIKALTINVPNGLILLWWVDEIGAVIHSVVSVSLLKFLMALCAKIHLWRCFPDAPARPSAPRRHSLGPNSKMTIVKIYQSCTEAKKFHKITS